MYSVTPHIWKREILCLSSEKVKPTVHIMQPLHLMTAEPEQTGSMLRMSLINVAVKSGPPSPCPFCCSVLVPLQCSQSQEQIVTLMMDTQPPPPLSTSHNPSAGLGSPPSHPLLRSHGAAERGSQPVRQPCSPHRFRESRRQPCILTSLALTSLGGDAAQFRRL